MFVLKGDRQPQGFSTTQFHDVDESTGVMGRGRDRRVLQVSHLTLLVKMV
jgi:hypothetical protein